MKEIFFHRFDVALDAEPWELKNTLATNSGTSGAWELRLVRPGTQKRMATPGFKSLLRLPLESQYRKQNL